MSRRLIYIILNPFFQAFLVASLIIVFLPFGQKKYITQQVEMTTHFDGTQFVYADLDHNGFSERIHTFLNLAGNAGIALREGIHTLGQWNFRGIYEPLSPRLMIGNFDQDPNDEIYIFTLAGDTILLNGLEFSDNPELFLRDRFICRLGKSLMNPDFILYPAQIIDMTGDNSGDLVFAVNAGHSRQPRNVYVYDIKNDSLMKSPESGAFIGGIIIENLDQDLFPEIIVSTYASSNYNELPVKYSDTSSWFMILDHDLKFKFPPIEFPGRTGGVMAQDIETTGQGKNIFCSAAYGTPRIDKIRWFISDINGNVVKERYLKYGEPANAIGIMPRPEGFPLNKVFGLIENNGFYEIDSNLNEKKISRIKFSTLKPNLVDLDMDGKDEIIVLNPDHKQHLVFQDDFSNPVELNFPIQQTNPVFSVKLRGNEPPQLSVQGDQDWKLFDYGINPVYRFRFLVWSSVYFVILGFILLIRKLYSFQLKKRYETEKKIATLQLSSVKAQMEPHFIMNTINTIGSSIYRQKPDEAYNLLLNFSGMVRSLLMSSDKLTRTLKDELEFVKNYLDLEKTRFGEVFSYKIHEKEGINPDAIIPKMIIQLHAENALKHGLIPKKKDGLLDISVEKEHEYIVITITDNGIGRNMASRNISQSTGRGMKILGQFFETYNRYNKIKLKQEITDLFDSENQPAGTIVKIFVPEEFNEGIY